MDVQLTYNTATGRTVIQEQKTTVAVLLLLETTTGGRTLAATYGKKNMSVKVSSQLFIFNNRTAI